VTVVVVLLMLMVACDMFELHETFVLTKVLLCTVFANMMSQYMYVLFFYTHVNNHFRQSTKFLSLQYQFCRDQIPHFYPEVR
jgi:hypothetical protein